VCASEIFRNPRSLPSVVAQFIGLPLLSLRSSLCHCEERSDEAISVGANEIATHLSGARNDSGKQLDESSNYKNLEVKYEDNT